MLFYQRFGKSPSISHRRYVRFEGAATLINRLPVDIQVGYDIYEPSQNLNL